jgi:hypothetical protein
LIEEDVLDGIDNDLDALIDEEIVCIFTDDEEDFDVDCEDLFCKEADDDNDGIFDDNDV